MIVSYYISEDDYISAARLSNRFTFKKAKFYLIVLVIVAAVFLLPSPSFVEALLVGGMIGLFIVEILSRSFVNAILLKKQYREYAAIKKQQGVELIDNGLQFSSPDASMLLRWEAITKWRYNKDFILLYQNRRLYHVVPQSVTEAGFDIDLLKLHLTEHVGEAV